MNFFLPGAAALSRFRLDRLCTALRALDPRVTGVDARDVPLGHHRLRPGLAVAKGGEVGMFHLGSTAVLFFEKRAGAVWAREAGSAVRYGERLLTSSPVKPVGG